MTNLNTQQVKRRRLEGTVVSDKMMKTRVVAVTRFRRHPKYLKYYRVTRRYKAHDEKNAYRVGDKVVIEETRPLSKEKRWRIVGLVQK
jgi:small subunit ribosomal protein S17